ncbi:MAG: hypothetical protein ACYC6Y_26650 [Thermoguttaceae bacterium]
MKGDNRQLRLLVAVACLATLAAAGCHGWGSRRDHAPAPLGTLSDPIWRNQESNAEHSDFVIHMHEFQGNTERLNTAGEDHVKQIAARLLSGQEAQVLVERSMTSARPETKYQYRVHPNVELDLARREIVVRSLAAMGITDAEQRVVVSPALTPGMTADEAEGAYRAGVTGSGMSAPGGGFGGFYTGAGMF